MKVIAFKRAKKFQQLLDLHPEFIVEFADISLFPADYHKEVDGYEFLVEDLFQQELDKNQELHDYYISEKQKREQEELKRMEFQDSLERKKQELLQREFEEFLKWKQKK